MPGTSRIKLIKVDPEDGHEFIPFLNDLDMKLMNSGLLEPEEDPKSIISYCKNCGIIMLFDFTDRDEGISMSGDYDVCDNYLVRDIIE